jgi:hypothetical protein
MAKQALSEAAIRRKWVDAGGDPRLAGHMARIGKRESGGRYWINNAGLNRNGTVDHGLFQINDIWRKDPVIGKLWSRRYDPDVNAQMAVRVMAKQGPRAWATFNPATDAKYIKDLGSGPIPAASKPRKAKAPPESVTTTETTVKSTPTTVSDKLDTKGLAKAQRQAQVFQFLSKGNPNHLFQRIGLTESPDPLDFMTKDVKLGKTELGTKKVKVKAPQQGREPRRQAKGRPDMIFEMFYDPGISVDSGRRTSAIGGHGSHIHLAAPRGRVMKLAKMAQKMGLHVREFEPFDRVDPVHTGKSFHYRGEAADISGDPKRMARFNRMVARRYGYL